MGGIEVCEGSSCHGALMEMKASEVLICRKHSSQPAS
jgi:hypothetical protein